ncbi:MAG: FAD binding domain-containing protein [Phycisphaerae bacterium]|nr:FAD binding domain-containing protein [Phycisphaerae bacterium]
MFSQPTTLEEALDVRARCGPDLLPIAGGTDIVVAMNRGQLRPAGFLDLTHVRGLDAVRHENGRYECGGAATHATLSRLPVEALAEAALSVGGPAIRNRGTIGGNLVTASPAGDGCVALLALDADVELAHASRGRRVVPLREYFLGYRKTALLADELITRVRFPKDWITAWYKIGKRGSVNISVVCCAIGRSPTGLFHIALGSVAATPIRAPHAEEIVNRDGLTDGAIAEAADAVRRDISPIDDHRASAKYRAAMSVTLVARLLRRIRDRVKEPAR